MDSRRISKFSGFLTDGDFRVPRDWVSEVFLRCAGFLTGGDFRVPRDRISEGVGDVSVFSPMLFLSSGREAFRRVFGWILVVNNFCR